MKFEDFYDDVVQALSGYIVDVELDETDVNSAFRLAKKTYQQKGSHNEIRRYVKIPVSRNQYEYDLPKEVKDVVEIVKPRGSFNVADPFSHAIFNDLFSNVSGSTGSTNGFIHYDLVLQQLGNIRKYIVYDTPFVQDRTRNKLILRKRPEFDGCWLLDCYLFMTDEEYMDNLWVFNYTVAESKKRLGRAYRKFGSLPSPSGEAQLDGDQLVQEAQEEIRGLNEDIDNFMDGDPDGLGMYIG